MLNSNHNTHLLLSFLIPYVVYKLILVLPAFWTSRHRAVYITNFRSLRGVLSMLELFPENSYLNLVGSNSYLSPQFFWMPCSSSQIFLVSSFLNLSGSQICHLWVIWKLLHALQLVVITILWYWVSCFPEINLPHGNFPCHKIWNIWHWRTVS